MNWCQGDDFLSISAQTGTIKLAMAGTYVGLVAPIVGLLILYGYNMMSP